MLSKKIAAFAAAAAVAVGIIAAVPVYAQQSEKGLKDYYANYFRIGTCYPYQQTSDAALRNVILREFNSITPENGLKPDATIQNISADDEVTVQFNSEAKAVMDFCVANNIPLRGHTLVWHSQTPQSFFQKNGQQASKEVMYKRMESYIKNMFAAIKSQYPTLNLYAYDVVNEIFENNGKPRAAGFGGDNSPWVQIFGDNSFVDSAFTYARRYAPASCKLFYNDYNEYHPDGKKDSIAAMATRLGPNGRNVLDGIGMQSHLSTSWPDMGTYKTALTKFIGVEGVEVHVTELDITIESGDNETKQAELYESVFQAYKEAREAGANITSVSIWGVRDDLSWRSDRKPLLFTSSYAKKPAYNSVAALIPEKNWGDGKNPQFNTPDPEEAEADENGYFFHHDFEDNTTMKWSRRGDNTTLTNTTAQKNGGSRSVLVSNRNDTWHGAIFSLPDREFKAGGEYSFSVMARHDGNETKTISLSFQYNNPSGTESYDNIASAEAAPGQWVQIANPSYKIPEGSNFSIYVELSDGYTNFYFDDAMGGVKGAKINADGTPDKPSSVRASQNTVRGHSQLVTVKGKTLSVSAAAGSQVKVRVVNLSGKTVANFSTRGGANLSLGKLPAGSYIVEARVDGRRVTRSVVLR